MKKIIIAFTMLAFGTVSAQAFDRSIFSVTAGLATNKGVFGASAKETNRNDSNVIVSEKKEEGVFEDSFGSQFIELGIGPIVSFGYERTPDSITTPTNTSREGNAAGENNVSVDFNDLNTTYIRINLPFVDGMYAKYGKLSTDLDIKESMGSGSTYSNISTNGTTLGLGYHKFIKDSRVGLRIEGAYLDLDNVSTSNGVSASGATVANSGQNLIDGSNLQGLTAKVALTVTFGKD